MSETATVNPLSLVILIRIENLGHNGMAMRLYRLNGCQFVAVPIAGEMVIKVGSGDLDAIKRLLHGFTGHQFVKADDPRKDYYTSYRRVDTATDLMTVASFPAPQIQAVA